MSSICWGVRRFVSTFFLQLEGPEVTCEAAVSLTERLKLLICLFKAEFKLNKIKRFIKAFKKRLDVRQGLSQFNNYFKWS